GQTQAGGTLKVHLRDPQDLQLSTVRTSAVPLLPGTGLVKLAYPASTRFDGRGDVHDPRRSAEGGCSYLRQSNRITLTTPRPLGDGGESASLIKHKVPDRAHRQRHAPRGMRDRHRHVRAKCHVKDRVNASLVLKLAGGGEYRRISQHRPDPIDRERLG